MCLAVPAKLTERDGEFGWVNVGQARSRVSLLMTPDAQPGQWVLVHAGFAIQSIAEHEARATWNVIEQIENLPQQEGEQ